MKLYTFRPSSLELFTDQKQFPKVLTFPSFAIQDFFRSMPWVALGTFCIQSKFPALSHDPFTGISVFKEPALKTNKLRLTDLLLIFLGWTLSGLELLHPQVCAPFLSAQAWKSLFAPYCFACRIQAAEEFRGIIIPGTTNPPVYEDPWVCVPWRLHKPSSLLPVTVFPTDLWSSPAAEMEKYLSIRTVFRSYSE